MKTLKTLLSANLKGTQHFFTDQGWAPMELLSKEWFDQQDEQEIAEMVHNGNYKSLAEQEGMTDCDFYDEDEGMNVCLDSEVRELFPSKYYLTKEDEGIEEVFQADGTWDHRDGENMDHMDLYGTKEEAQEQIDHMIKNKQVDTNEILIQEL